MGQTILGALLAEEGIEAVDADTVADFLDGDAQGVTALFFTGDPEKKLETADVAVVMRELVRDNGGRLRMGIVDRADERELMKKCGVFAFPSVAFFAGRHYLDTIPKIQDWSVYQDKMPGFFKKAADLGAAGANEAHGAPRD